MLAKVVTPTGEKLHGTTVSYYVVIEAKDGYKAVFAWPELDAAFTDRIVLLATNRDGKPLPESEGPFRLVVPDEKKAGRWVRQVTAVRIRRAT